MRGDLVEKTAADVCRELAARGASGILAIDGPGGPGRVVFADGRIIAAVSPTPRARLGDRLVGAGELDPDDLANALAAQQEKGESLPLGSLLVERGLVRRDAVRVFVQEQVLDALFEVICWRYGAFTFTADDDARGHGVPLSLSVDDALVEVARRQQEWNELSQVIPDLDSVPSFRVGAASASAALEPDEFAVLASVDGVRSVRALAADLGYGEFEAARIVYGLSLLGIVDVRPPQDEIGAALEDALGLGDFEPFDDEAGQAPEPSPQPEEAATPPEDVPPPSEPAPTATAPTPPPSHLRVVADPPEPPPEPPPPSVPAPTDQPTPSEPAATERPREGKDEEPDIWVSTEGSEPAPQTDADEPAAVEPDEPTVATTLEHDDHPPPSPDEEGAVIDAEVELPVDTVAEDDAAVRPDDDDDSPDRWEDLFSAAEQAASDRPATEGDPEESAPPQPTPTGGPAAPTTGPEPWNATPPPTAPTTGPETDRESPPEDAPPPSPSDPDSPERPAARTPTPPSEEPSEDPAAETPEPPAEPAPGQRGDDNDVSEFLRELSRLSVDGPSESGPAKPPYRPTSSTSSSDADNAKKKRRGLFGRG